MLAWIGGGILALVLLLLAGLVFLNTPPGHQLLAGLVERIPLPGGVRLHVGAIQGSIYGRMTLDAVTVADSQGAFLTAPRVVVDWNPSGLLHREVSVQELSALTIRLLRRPVLQPSPPRPNRPLLPNVSLDLGHLSIGTLWLEAPVTGDQRRLGVLGAFTLVRGRTQAQLDVRAKPSGGAAAGDRLSVRIDAEPARNRLILDAHLAAPKGGVIDRLAHLDEPLTAAVQGQGGWSDWKGTASAILGGRLLLQADLSAHTGRFDGRGRAYPDGLVKGPEAALTRPGVDFDVSGSLGNHRQLDAMVQLASPAFEFAAAGRLDLGRSRFAGLKLHARLEQPSALSDNLSGRDLRMDATVDGAFSHPAVTYQMQASSIGVGGKVAHDLDAQGQAVPTSGNGWTARFRATVSGVSGVQTSVSDLAKRLDMRGTARLDGHRIVLPDLEVSSDHLHGKAHFDLDFDTGRYAGSMSAQARRLAVKGVGIVDASVDLKVSPAAHGYRASGNLHGRLDQIVNTAAAKLLGGPATLDAEVSRSADGRLAMSNLKVSAPRFQVADGRAAYGPGDRISASATAVSQTYGPLRLNLAGSLAAPQATLHADDLGVAGLRAIDLNLQGQGGGDYRARLRGQSAYGPVSTDVAFSLKAGSIRATVREALLAGISASGRVAGATGGPLAGTITVAGRGLTGTLGLSAAGKAQALDVALKARNASLPISMPVTIARGMIEARVLLYPKAPSIRGAAELEGVHAEAVAIDRMRAQASYASGAGTATLTARGQHAIPFTVALSARVSPTVIRVDGQGSVDRIPIRFSSPATVRRIDHGYVLEPTVLTSGEGRVEASGRYARGAQAVLRVEDLDLGLSRVFAPGLGLAGRATGSANLDLPLGQAPTGQVRLQITGFTRSTAAEVSEPVGLTLAADLTPAAAEVHALVKRRGGANVGRLQARVALASRGSWMQRLRAGAVSGGIRYNGPADTLWSFAGVANQSLSGPLAIGADVSGTLDRPRLTGLVRAKSLRYENTDFGTAIDHIAIQARFVDTRLELTALTGAAGSGSISAKGYADLSAADGYPIDLRVRLADAQLAKSDSLAATVSGDLSIAHEPRRTPTVSGDLTLDQGRYQIVRQGKDEIVELTGVHRAGQPLAELAPSSAPAVAQGLPAGWALNIHVHAPQQLYVRGMGLDSEWQSNLTITGDLKNPIVVGDVTLVRGTFSFAGRDLMLSRGVIHLNGANPPNPTLDIEASSTVEDLTAMIDITGTAHAPQITFSSTPALPQDEVLSRLLFGTSMGQLSALQALQLASSINALRGGAGLSPLAKLRQATGFDRLRFYGADKTTGRGPSIGAGRYIAKNLYVELTTDARGFTATQIELSLTKTLRLLSQVGAFSGTQFELRYSRDY